MPAGTIHTRVAVGLTGSAAWRKRAGRILAAISQESEDVRGEHGVGKSRVCSRVRQNCSCEAGAARGSKLRCDPPPPQDRFRIDRRKGTRLAGRFTAAVMVLLLAAASATVPIRSQPAAAQAASSRSLVVAWGGSLSDVGTAASLVAAGEGAAVVYAESPQSLGLESGALVAQVAPSRVLLVGGAAVLAPSIDEELRGLVDGIAIERLAGSTRIETAALAAERVLGAQETVVLANGWSLPDVGAAASAVASGTADAVLYASRDGLGANTRRVLSDRRPSAVLIAGGPAALSNSVAAEAANAAGTESRRLGGATRVETAASIARQAFEAGAEVAVIANGWSLDDVGIAASLAAGLGDAAVLYAATADELSATTENELRDRPLRRIFVVGRVDEISERTFVSLLESVPTVRIEVPGSATRHALDRIGAPEGLRILESAEVGPEGATVEADGVVVIVPPESVSRGTTVTIRETVGQYGNAEIGGHVVTVDHDDPVHAPITVTWDVSHLTESDIESLLVVGWEQSLSLWVPTYDDVQMTDGKLTINTSQWGPEERSWSSLLEVISTAVHNAFSNAAQTAKEVTGYGVDAPKCTSSSLPNWVESVTEPGETRHAAIRLCYEPKENRALRMRAANNRTLSQLVYHQTPATWGTAWSTPELKFVYTITGALYHAAHEAQTNSDRVFIPPLNTVNADIERPDQAGRHRMTLTARIEWDSILIDLILFIADTADVTSKIVGKVADWNETLSELVACGLKGTSRIDNVPRRGLSGIEIKKSLVDLTVAIEACGTELFDKLKKTSSRHQKRSSGRGNAIPAHNKSLARLANNLKKASKVKRVADFAVLLVDWDQYESDTWTIKASGPQSKALPTSSRGISAGEHHTCAITKEKRIVCWGWRDGRTDAPIGKFQTVVAGRSHNCAIRTNGTVACWGSRQDDVVRNTPSASVKFTDISLSHESDTHFGGGTYACGITDARKLLCWGQEFGNILNVPSGAFRSVASSVTHSCAIRTIGTLSCWGSDIPAVTEAPTSIRFTSVVTGNGWSCAIRANKTLQCWGRWDGEGPMNRLTVSSRPSRMTTCTHAASRSTESFTAGASAIETRPTCLGMSGLIISTLSQRATISPAESGMTGP